MRYEINKKVNGPLYVTEEDLIKLNYRCKKEEQQGEGPGSCGGSKESSSKSLQGAMDKDFKNGIKQIEKAKFGTSTLSSDAQKYISEGLSSYKGKASSEELRSNLGRSEVIDAVFNRYGKGMSKDQFKTAYLVALEKGIRSTPKPKSEKSSSSNKASTSKKLVDTKSKKSAPKLPKGAKVVDNGNAEWEDTGPSAQDSKDKFLGSIAKLGWKVENYQPHKEGSDGRMHLDNNYVSPDGKYTAIVTSSWSKTDSKDRRASIKIKKNT